MWLKGTPNSSGLLPSTQPIYAAAKNLEWQSYQINNCEVRKKNKNILEIFVFIYIEHVKFQNNNNSNNNNNNN